MQLVVEDPSHEIQHLLLGAGDRPDEFPGVRFVDALLGLALLPLRRQAHTVGVLCFGSRDPQRFHHGLSADFLPGGDGGPGRRRRRPQAAGRNRVMASGGTP